MVYTQFIDGALTTSSNRESWINYNPANNNPLGEILGIGAWNYPIQITAWKAAPALACGNSMIFKPSELTPATALELAKVFMEAGAPPGLFNVVQGDGRVGSMLVEHPGIAKISLTGSVSTGKKIFTAAAAQLKKVTLELGGKSPLIIFEDADIHNAVSAAMLANFYTQGEVCSNGTRVFVHRKIFDSFLWKLKDRTEKIRLGDPTDPDTQMGALISKAHMEKVIQFIDSGKSSGATLLTGGFRPEKDFNGRDITSGNFLAPAIFTDCDDSMEICKEEIFGPVLSILPFDSEEEVIQRANNTAYGLSAGVFTNDIKRGHRVIHQLQAGTCWINNYNITPIELPLVGINNQARAGRIALLLFNIIPS